MNATVTYKCPNCDAGLIFNAEEQKFSCEFCLSHFTEEELAATSTAERVEEMEKANAEFAGEMREYHCPSCGAEVIAELQPSERDYVVPKRRYSGFFQTDLDMLLRELGVETVVMTGLHTHMCVRHTSADAYSLGYDVVVAKEATDSFTEEDYLSGLAYLKTCYGADAYTNSELVEMF